MTSLSAFIPRGCKGARRGGKKEKQRLNLRAGFFLAWHPFWTLDDDVGNNKAILNLAKMLSYLPH